MSPNIWYYIYKYKTYFYRMLATVDRFGSRNRNFMFFCFMVLVCCFRLCRVHLFTFLGLQFLKFSVSTRSHLLTPDSTSTLYWGTLLQLLLTGPVKRKNLVLPAASH